jgi:LmbE family N-acetylglucosaminyl deacetylase
MKVILILAPHTDDGELGCGGTIAKLCNEGYRVIYVAFSTCRRSLPEGWEPDTLAKEVKKAVEILGVAKDDLLLFDYDVRKFKEDRQRILEDIIELRKKYAPDTVFVPCTTDIHQDHQVISEEGLRAFKSATVYGYEMPWNNISFNAHAFMKLKKEFVEKKVEALMEYKSQQHRPYVNREFIFSLATVRGVQIGSEYAESFEVIRSIL